MAEYANRNDPAWNDTTIQGATIKDALDFAMTISAGASGENEAASELYPNIAAVASVYGDADGKYTAFLTQAEPEFSLEAYYLWNQPFAEKEGLNSAKSKVPSASSSANGRNSTSSISGASKESSTASRIAAVGCWGLITSVFVYGLM